MKTKAKAVLAQICLKLFVLMYSRSWTGVQYVVHEEAKRGAADMLRQWLKYHRLRHCERCLTISGTMRLAHVELEERQVYLCEKCMAQGQQAGVAKPALNLAKP